MKLRHLVYISLLMAVLVGMGLFTAGCGASKAQVKAEYDRGFEEGYKQEEADCQAMKEGCIEAIGAYRGVIKEKNDALRKFNQEKKGLDLEKKARQMEDRMKYGSGPTGDEEWMK